MALLTSDQSPHGEEPSDDLTAKSLQTTKCSSFVNPDEAAVAHDVGHHKSREMAFRSCPGHAVVPSGLLRAAVLFHSASTNRLSGINASASLHGTGPAPHGRGVARLPSDCHAAAVEAREGEAVEGFAQGRALVPQHADSHFLAERH
jgi:hypothetical protein